MEERNWVFFFSGFHLFIHLGFTNVKIFTDILNIICIVFVFHLCFLYLYFFYFVFLYGRYCIFCQRPLPSCYECAPKRETRFLRIQEIMMRHNGTIVSNFKRPKRYFYILYIFFPSFLLFCFLVSLFLFFFLVFWFFICSCFHLLIFILSPFSAFHLFVCWSNFPVFQFFRFQFFSFSLVYILKEISTP